MSDPSIKERMKPGDYHVVVDRSQNQATAFDHKGHKVWRNSVPALARGYQSNWRLRGGDTPPGLYVVGKVFDIPKNDRDYDSYGDWCVDLVDLTGNEDGNGRSGISVHGGGSAAPNPHADFQPLLHTEGCIRFHNYHMRHNIIPLINQAKKAGCKVYFTVLE